VAERRSCLHQHRAWACRFLGFLLKGSHRGARRRSISCHTLGVSSWAVGFRLMYWQWSLAHSAGRPHWLDNDAPASSCGQLQAVTKKTISWINPFTQQPKKIHQRWCPVVVNILNALLRSKLERRPYAELSAFVGALLCTYHASLNASAQRNRGSASRFIEHTNATPRKFIGRRLIWGSYPLFVIISHDFAQLHLNHILRCHLVNFDGLCCF